MASAFPCLKCSKASSPRRTLSHGNNSRSSYCIESVSVSSLQSRLPKSPLILGPADDDQVRWTAIFLDYTVAVGDHAKPRAVVCGSQRETSGLPTAAVRETARAFASSATPSAFGEPPLRHEKAHVRP